MILRTYKDPCETCGQVQDKESEYKVRERVKGIEFDRKGNRYIVFMLDDPPEATKAYLKQIKKKEIKPSR